MEVLRFKVRMLGRDASGGFRVHGIHLRRVGLAGSADFVYGWTAEEEEPLDEPCDEAQIEALRSGPVADGRSEDIHPLLRSFEEPTLEAVCARLSERLDDGVRKAVVELAAEAERPLVDVLYARRAILAVPGVAYVGLKRETPQIRPTAVRLRFADEIGLVGRGGTPVATIALTQDRAVVVDLPWSAAAAAKAVEGDIERLRFALRFHADRRREDFLVSETVMLVRADPSVPWGLFARVMGEATSRPAYLTWVTLFLTR